MDNQGSATARSGKHRILPLPDHVISQIKSSITITSLTAVIHGLVENSLDAQATKINVSLSFIKGNCTVEDDGHGIHPDEFTEAGAIGKRFRPSNPFV